MLPNKRRTKSSNLYNTTRYNSQVLRRGREGVMAFHELSVPMKSATFASQGRLFRVIYSPAHPFCIPSGQKVS